MLDVSMQSWLGFEDSSTQHEYASTCSNQWICQLSSFVSPQVLLLRCRVRTADTDQRKQLQSIHLCFLCRTDLKGAVQAWLAGGLLRGLP